MTETHVHVAWGVVHLLRWVVGARWWGCGFERGRVVRVVSQQAVHSTPRPLNRERLNHQPRDGSFLNSKLTHGADDEHRRHVSRLGHASPSPRSRGLLVWFRRRRDAQGVLRLVQRDRGVVALRVLQGQPPCASGHLTHTHSYARSPVRGSAKDASGARPRRLARAQWPTAEALAS